MKKLAEMLGIEDIEKIFEHIYAGIAIVDRDGTLLAWNAIFGECMTRHPGAKGLGKFFLEQDREMLHVRLSSKDVEHWVSEFPLHGDASIVPCDCMLLPTTNEYKVFIAERIESESGLQMAVEKLSRRVKLFQIESAFTKTLAHKKQIELDAVVAQAKEVAQTDALTFLFNRRAIIRELQDEVMRAERYGSTLSVSILDVDHFKSINDTYGHPVGDEVLRQVAQHLRDGIRHPDIVGRYGGEEFIILLPNSDVTAASEQAARLCKQMSETTVQVKENSIQVTLSIGVAQLRIGEDTWDILLNRADNAMYEAKNRGRSCWVVAD